MSLRLYLDEDVDVLLKPLLASRGHDVLTAAEAGALGWLDEKHLPRETKAPAHAATLLKTLIAPRLQD